MTERQIKLCQTGLWQNKMRTRPPAFSSVNSGVRVEFRPVGLRAVVYYDHVVKYPYTPCSGRVYKEPNDNNESDQEVSARRAENRAKNKLARLRRAKKIIRACVKVAAGNGGIFFTVTTGKSEIDSKAFGRLMEHMQRKYGLLYYVWVVERTKAGYIHYHIAGVFRFRGLAAVNYLKQNKRIVELSNWWAALIGIEQHGNSIRLGWDYDSKNSPRKYLIDKDGVDYLVKYLFKDKAPRRRWGTNMDFLYPVRWQLVEYIGFAEKPHKIWQIVSQDDKYLAEYHIEPACPEFYFAGEPQIKQNSAGLFVEIYLIQRPPRYFLREMVANLNLN